MQYLEKAYKLATLAKIDVSEFKTEALEDRVVDILHKVVRSSHVTLLDLYFYGFSSLHVSEVEQRIRKRN